ncbi:MAG TPA: HAD family hydrolase [Polyangiaceae bacterium]
MLLVTDLDGTLLDENGQVRPRDREAIRALRKKGVRVSICTGRMYSGTRAIAHSLELEGPIGCLDGSQIADARDGTMALCLIDPDTATVLVHALSEYQPASFVFSNDMVFHDQAGDPYIEYVSTWSDQSVRLEDVVGDPRWSEKDRISAVVALGSEEQIRGIELELLARGARVQIATYTISREGYLGLWGSVIRAAGPSKGTALTFIARHHDLDPRDVVAIGDWLNDIPMLQAAGRSFAMAHASEQVKAAAAQVLESSSATGGAIAEAAERVGFL